MKLVINFFDKLEDQVRGSLSHHPFIYAFLGGSGVILFWRGVWHTADYFEKTTVWGSLAFSNFGSMVVGIVMLLMTGLFVSVFIGDSMILSGLRGEKKLVEKTEDEIESEISKEEKILKHLENDLHKIVSHNE